MNTGIDMKEFLRMKKEAEKIVAVKVEEAKTILAELAELVEATGVKLNLKNELEDAIYNVDKHHPDWNTSSYDC